MTQANSPLRYPGGKSCLYPLVAEILQENGLKRAHYAEPYAGGSSLALALLFAGQVSDIHLNDVDPGIWCFWHSVLNETDAFLGLVESATLNVEEWRRQREIYRNGPRQRTTRARLCHVFSEPHQSFGNYRYGGL